MHRFIAHLVACLAVFCVVSVPRISEAAYRAPTEAALSTNWADVADYIDLHANHPNPVAELLIRLESFTGVTTWCVNDSGGSGGWPDSGGSGGWPDSAGQLGWPSQHISFPTLAEATTCAAMIKRLSN